MVRRIEISFPADVELPDGFDRVLTSLVDLVCKEYERRNPTRVMWPAGQGFKPNWSAVDATFLGVEQGPSPVADGEEPTFDESIYTIDCSEREDLHGENPLNPDRDRLRKEISDRRKAQHEAEPKTVNILRHDQNPKNVTYTYDRTITDKEMEYLRRNL